MVIAKANANSVDPDQTPCSASSDLGLRCLPMSLLWNARHKWVNTETCNVAQLNSVWLKMKEEIKTSPDSVVITSSILRV